MTVWLVLALLAGFFAGFFFAAWRCLVQLRDFWFAVLDAGQASRADVLTFLDALIDDKRTPEFVRTSAKAGRGP